MKPNSQISLLNSLLERIKFYEDRNQIVTSIELDYQINIEEKDVIKEALIDTFNKVGDTFTFKEFNTEFKKQKVNLDLTFFAKQGYIVEAKQSLILTLFNPMYKVCGKERLFYYIKIS